MKKDNLNIHFSDKDETPYLKYLREGNKKFYDNDFKGVFGNRQWENPLKLDALVRMGDMFRLLWS